MDSATSPISFPTIARLPDEVRSCTNNKNQLSMKLTFFFSFHSRQSERARSKPAPGATASPTFNASWLPQLTSSSLQPRNNLCSLDLASSLPVSKQPSAAPQRESAITKQRSTVFASANSTTFGSPRRQAPTNTPPLTPSSSFASSGGTETDQESTLLRTPPSESSSPDHPRWVKDNTTYLSTSFPNSTHLHPSSPLDADLADFLSSKVGALHLDSHDNDQTPKADKTLHSDSIPHLHPPPSFSLHADNPQLDMDVLFTRPDPPPTNFIAVSTQKVTNSSHSSLHLYPSRSVPFHPSLPLTVLALPSKEKHSTLLRPCTPVSTRPTKSSSSGTLPCPHPLLP